MPKLEPPEKPLKVEFRLPNCEKLTTQPLVQLQDVSFNYNAETPLLENVDLTVAYDSRICIVRSFKSPLSFFEFPLFLDIS